MKKFVKLLSIFIAIMLVTTTSNWTTQTSRAATTLTVSPSEQYQTWDGWGTSLAWWANVVGGWNNAMEDELVDKIFSQTTGLGFNMLRYNIGGGENPTHSHMDARPGAEMPGFKATEASSYDWLADENQISVLRAAKAKGANILEAFVNSAPYWMTYNLCASGNFNGGNNLKQDYYDNFATYVVDTLTHFRTAESITFNTISPLNEPISTWWVGLGLNGTGGNNQEGMHFDLANQQQILKELHMQLNTSGELAYTKISGPEEYNIDSTFNTFNQYDAATKSKIHQINSHSYGTRANEYKLKNIAAQHGKKVWISELGNNGAGDIYDIDASMNLSNVVLNDLKNLKATGWHYWQAIEDSAGDNNYGLIKANFEGPNGYNVTKKYYAMGNYSKYIKQGYKIIGINNGKSVAAYDAASQKLVIVTTNDTTTAQDFTYDLSAFSTVGTGQGFRTSGTEDLASVGISISNKQFTHTAAPRSVTTYVISGAAYTLPTQVTFNPALDYKIVNRNSGKTLTIAGTDKNADGALVQQFTDTGAAYQRWQISGLGNGYFIIVNRQSGDFMDINGASTADGANNIQWPNTGGINQQWKIVDLGTGYYNIINQNSGKYLDINGASLLDGAQNIQWQANGALNQQWQIVSSAATDTQVPSTPSSLTATTVSDTQINLSWTASTDNVGVSGYKIYRGGVEVGSTTGTSFSDIFLSKSTAYSYTVKAYDYVQNLSSASNSANATTLAGITNGATFKMVARHSGKLAGISGDSTADGANVVQLPDSGHNSQKWVITDLGNGYFKVINVNSGKSLDIYNASTANGAKAIQWPFSGPNNQQWQITDVGSGYFKTIARHSLKALEVKGSSTVNGTQIQQNSYSGGTNQQWQLVQQ
ncbi:MAG TPA: RICIN domain-containing protein [Bacilli bacterium]